MRVALEVGLLLPETTVEISYTVLGADGNKYGPINLETLQGWLREGRVTGETQVLRSDLNAWYPAGSYSEVGMTNPQTAQPAAARLAAQPARTAASPVAVAYNPAATLAHSTDMAALEKRIRTGASWFYWIAAFSVINSIIAMSGSERSFFLGLSITQVLDAMAKAASGSGVVGLVVGILAAGVLVLFGVCAHKKQTWAFVVGTVLYGLDTILTLFVAIFAASMWIGVLIHAVAMFSFIAGLSANVKYNRLVRAS